MFRLNKEASYNNRKWWHSAHVEL